MTRLHEDKDTGAALRGLYAAAGGVQAVFDHKVADYQASRPDYPAALFDTLAERLTPTRVADVGAGTGLLTQGLLARGWQVLAVEPNAQMRAACDAWLGARPGYRSAEGRAEAIPAPDASLDLITAAQAFHWFEPEAARAEVQRVLTPAGQVALIWNDRQREQPLHRALDEEVFARHGGEGRLRLLAHEDRSQVARFFARAAPFEQRWPHAHGLSEAGLISLVFSRSYMPRPDTEQGQLVTATVREIFARFAREGQVLLPYTTVLMLGRP
jgi:SAM-dependent methyltransferase